MIKLTTDIFKSYLQCKYKAVLKISGEVGIKSDYENMLSERGFNFKIKAFAKSFHITSGINTTAVILNKHGGICPSEWNKAFVNVEVDDGTICSHCDVCGSLSEWASTLCSSVRVRGRKLLLPLA